MVADSCSASERRLGKMDRVIHDNLNNALAAAEHHNPAAHVPAVVAAYPAIQVDFLFGAKQRQLGSLVNINFHFSL